MAGRDGMMTDQMAYANNLDTWLCSGRRTAAYLGIHPAAEPCAHMQWQKRLRLKVWILRISQLSNVVSSGWPE